jgi:hypothetical protein
MNLALIMKNRLIGRRRSHAPEEITTTWRSLMIDIRQARLAYLVSVIGVTLTASAAALGLMRTMFRPGVGLGDNQHFVNMTVGNMTAVGNMNRGSVYPFGSTDNLAVVGVIIAIVGLAWLGLTLLKLKRIPPPNIPME